MHVDLDPFLEISGCSDCQPNSHISKEYSQKGMNKHVPSPVVSEPSIDTYQKNDDNVPTNKEDAAMWIEI